MEEIKKVVEEYEQKLDDLHNPAPIEFDAPKPEPTIGEIKKARKLYWTVSHPKVVACEHRLDLTRQPAHRNCQHCWFAWFNEHGEIVQQLDEMFVTGPSGVDMIIQLQGIKFYKMWRKFMSTIAKWKEEADANSERENNNQQTA